MGRDLEGAKQVNLVDLEKPGDIYTHVANLVEAKIIQISQNPKSPDFEIANKLKGQIKRKIVKQTVMTTVYGVTFIGINIIWLGARDQIQKQVKEYINFDNERDTYSSSVFIAKLTLESVADLFSQAHKIKKWLIDSCHIAVTNNQPISWITPLGIPVIQPYRTKSTKDVIKTFLIDFETSADSGDLPLSKRRQKSAFPPNYVHR